MNHQTIAVADLSLDPSNVRKHSRRNLDAIKASLRKFGQQKPIVVDAKGIVLAGNGTLTAAQELGWTEIQIVRTELAGVEATAFAIADNRTAELAEWEEDKLSQVLQSLKVEDADLLAATGYDAAEVDKMSKAELNKDEVPEPPADPITKAGDLWILGEHRVLCGDSTNAEDVGRVMAGANCDTLFYDPEWNIEFTIPAASFKNILAFGDGSTIGKMFSLFGPPTWLFAWDCVTSWFTPNRPLRRMKICAWHGDIDSFNLDGSHYGEPSESKTVSNSRGSYDFKADARGKHLSDVFQQPITKLHSASEHSHSKPIDWIRMLIADCTSGHIYDPFLGSGTTLIAAEQLGRKCYGMEISPAYCDVIVKRWENLTGKKAVLDKRTT
jgi:hypothetical protein